MVCEEMAEHAKVLSVPSVPNVALDFKKSQGAEAMITHQSCVFPEPS